MRTRRKPLAGQECNRGTLRDHEKSAWTASDNLFGFWEFISDRCVSQGPDEGVFTCLDFWDPNALL
jgi:hypothetical protein